MKLPHHEMKVKKKSIKKAKKLKNKIEELKNELKAIELNDLDSENQNYMRDNLNTTDINDNNADSE